MVRNRFASRLNYSLGNEDWRTEQQALQIKPTDSVFCVTASGDRSLNLLAQDCQKVTSVDMNPVQNELLRLKCAAIQSLDDYEEYLSFLGITPSAHRDISYAKVSKNLSPESAEFWGTKRKKIYDGIVYQGRVEKATKVIAMFAKLTMSSKVDRLFEMEDIEAQLEFLQEEWNSPFLKGLVDVVLSRKVMKLFAIDPGLFAHLPEEMRLGSYLFGRMHNCLNNCLAKESLLFSLIVRGYVERCALPLYLQADGFHSLKEKLSRLSIETEDLITHLGRVPAGSYDCLSMSDAASYMDKESFDKMIANIYHAAKPGARFCIRQFSSDHQLPEAFQNSFKRDTELEERLAHEDNCFVYNFMVGTIEKETL